MTILSNSDNCDKKLGRVAITIRSFSQKSPALTNLENHCRITFINTSGRRLSEDEIISAIRDADGILAGTEKISRHIMDMSPQLKVISRVGVGLDTIDLEAAQDHQILVRNTPEAPAIAVAEHTIALIFASLKHIPRYNTQMRQGDFSTMLGANLFGKKVGIIGMGRIGSRVATILENAGGKIWYFDPVAKNGLPDSWSRCDSLESLVADVDILSLHSPPLADKKPIIEEKLLSHAKKGMIIINTARGSLIDEAALTKALESGLVAGAALDVFSEEPYSGGLLKFPQVIVTPHVASNTHETRSQMEIEAVNNLIEGMRRRS